jgi:hypothetical protein
MASNSGARFEPKPHLVTAALVSFIISFITARVFTTFFPSTVLIANGIHVHHFWFGIVLLAIGGWIGISYIDKETDLLAAVLYGAGGGLIVDEVGLLLTFGNYWTSLTYTSLAIILAFIAVLLVISRYRRIMETELLGFLRNRISLYLGVFLLAVSVAFITETSKLEVTAVTSALTITSIVIIIIHFVQRSKKRSKRS